jgi:hypothetical protein
VSENKNPASKQKINTVSVNDELNTTSKSKTVPNDLAINSKELDEGKEEGNDSDGSDSEPSVDNLENEELLKLLPSYAKKKKKSKKKKQQLLITKILMKKDEEKVDKYESVGKDKMVKISKNPPISIRENSIKEAILTEKRIEKPLINIKQSIINRSYEKDRLLNDSRRKDEETQTEEIFFKMYIYY